jgi:hypothetical protein
MGLLANFEVMLIDETEFYKIVSRCGLSRRAYKRHNLVSYWRAWGVRPERKSVQVIFNQDIADWGEEDFGVAQVLDHVEVDGQGIEGLTTLTDLSRVAKWSRSCACSIQQNSPAGCACPNLFRSIASKARGVARAAASALVGKRCYWKPPCGHGPRSAVAVDQ